MLTITDQAFSHFQRLIQNNETSDLNLRLFVTNQGTRSVSYHMSFCEPEDKRFDDTALELDGFTLYIAADSSEYVADAVMDFKAEGGGGQIAVTNPNDVAAAPSDGASIEERVEYLLETEVNPMLASHGGMVSLVEVADGSIAVLRFGGGCQGCGAVSMTLKGGIEKTFKEHLPEITEVRDATDHESGDNPYYE